MKVYRGLFTDAAGRVCGTAILPAVDLQAAIRAADKHATARDFHGYEIWQGTKLQFARTDVRHAAGQVSPEQAARDSGAASALA